MECGLGLAQRLPEAFPPDETATGELGPRALAHQPPVEELNPRRGVERLLVRELDRDPIEERPDELRELREDGKINPPSPGDRRGRRPKLYDAP